MNRIVFLLCPLAVIANLVSLVRPRTVWLVAERPGEACDNGLAFFKYLRSEAVSIDARYVISPGERDYQRAAAVGPVVHRGSFAHYWLYSRARVATSTHLFGASPAGAKTRFIKFLSRRRLDSWLQHGVNKDHYSYYMGKSIRVDHIVFATNREFEYYGRYCQYAPNSAAVVGLCRFDSLSFVADRNVTVSNILFMPTFRRNLHSLTFLSHSESIAAFRSTQLFRSISSLLSNDELHQLLRNQGALLHFFPHSRLLPFQESFKDFESDVIRILGPEEGDLSELIRSCDLLVTDFSSVAFDFAYQGKEVVYYQTDVEDYRAFHYKEGYFSYLEDGFGPVVGDVRGLVDAIETLSESAETREMYLRRSNTFFPLRDKDNCRRTLQSLLAHPLLASRD